MSIYSAGLLAGRLVTGFSLDRLPAPAVAAVMTFIPAIGIALLLMSSSSFALAAAAVAMIGLQQGSEIDLIAYFVSRGFGRTHYGAIYGAVAMAGALSTAFALVFFGRVHDITGSYDVALKVGAAAFCWAPWRSWRSASPASRTTSPPKVSAAPMTLPSRAGECAPVDLCPHVLPAWSVFCEPSTVSLGESGKNGCSRGLSAIWHLAQHSLHHGTSPSIGSTSARALQTR